jgi:2'-5' RNA ligase
MKKRATVYWLVPSGHERALLRQVIRILSREFDAPNFAPHLTVFATAQDKSARKALQQIRCAPIRLRVGSVDFSSQFTKTLFVRFKSSAQLKKLTSDLARAVQSRGRSMTDLHVSLLYKKLPRTVKKELAATLRMPFREVVFDLVEAVHTVSPVKTRADVEAWRVVARKSLAGQPRTKR